MVLPSAQVVAWSDMVRYLRAEQLYEFIDGEKTNLDTMPTYNTKYKIDTKLLGIGGAAKVYGCTRIADGERLAIKILSDKIDNDKVERLKREINVIVDIVSNGIDGVLPIYDYDKENLWYVCNAVG